MNIDDDGPAANSPLTQPQSSADKAGIVASTVQHQQQEKQKPPIGGPSARISTVIRDENIVDDDDDSTASTGADGSVFCGTGTASATMASGGRSTPSPLSASGRRSRLRTYGGDRWTGGGGSGSAGSSGSLSGGLGAFSTARRVSFPENDAELVTGYLEPANPWATVKPINCISELSELYRDSCAKHCAQPIDVIVQHLDSLDDLSTIARRPLLNLREQRLTAASCEALEEVLKRVQYKMIDLTDCDLDDVSATALFDMIEYYEAANEIDISENRKITTRGWHSCINMIKRSHALQTLATRGMPLSESNAINMGKALLGSSLHTLKLEHCGLSGRPMTSLCNYLRRNTVLKELWLAHNDLSHIDAFNIAIVLKANYYLQFLDVSNNKIEDVGLLHITEALLEQARHLRSQQEEAIRLAVAAAAAAADAAAAAEAAAAAAEAVAVISAEFSCTPDDPPSTSLTDLSASPSTQSLLEYASIDDDDNDDEDDENDHGDVATDLPLIVEPAVVINAAAAVAPVQPKQRSTLESLLQTQKLQAEERQHQQTADAAFKDSENNVAAAANNNLNNNPGRSETGTQSTESSENTAVDASNIDRLSPEGLASDGQRPAFDLNENKPPAEMQQPPSPQHQPTNHVPAIHRTALDNLSGAPHQSDLIVFDEPLSRSHSVATAPPLATPSSAAAAAVVDLLSGTPTTAHYLQHQPALDLVPQVQKDSSQNRLNTHCAGDAPTDACRPLRTPSPPPPPLSPGLRVVHTPPASSSTPNPDRTPPIVHHHVDTDLVAQLKQATISTVEDIACETVEPASVAQPKLTSFAAMTVPTLTTANLKSLAAAAASGGPNNHHHQHPHHSTLSKSLDSSLNSSSMMRCDSDSDVGDGGGCPERSFSLESLNSETSVDSNDSKSSLKLAEQKFKKNGTLERQQQSAAAAAALALANQTAATNSAGSTTTSNTGSGGVAFGNGATNSHSQTTAAATPPPSGLQVLVLWNNGLTRDSAKTFGDLLAETQTLEILNVGRNVLSNDFLANVRDSLKSNTSLTSLGLQSAHLTCTGLRTLSECLEFGGNSTLQRIDVRDNHLQVAGLTALNDVLKSNKTVTRVDLDDVPRRAHDLGADSTIDYSRMVHNIRAQCARNENPPKPEPVRTTAINKRVHSSHLSSRKISLTCHSMRPTLDASGAVTGAQPGTATPSTTSKTTTTTSAGGDRLLLQPERKQSGRLRSPAPSPIPSPTPSPSRNRFHVSRVLETSPIATMSQSATTSPSTPPSLATSLSSSSSSSSKKQPRQVMSSSCSPTAFLPASQSAPKFSRFRVTTVSESLGSVTPAPVVTLLPKHKSVPDNLHRHEHLETATTAAATTTAPATVAAIAAIRPIVAVSPTPDLDPTPTTQPPLVVSSPHHTKDPPEQPKPQSPSVCPGVSSVSSLIASPPPLSSSPSPTPTSFCVLATSQTSNQPAHQLHLPYRSQEQVSQPEVSETATPTTTRAMTTSTSTTTLPIQTATVAIPSATQPATFAAVVAGIGAVKPLPIVVVPTTPRQQQHHRPNTPHASAVHPEATGGTASSTSFLSGSLDSPDMEVKRYMDDSCSSVSSMDSINYHADLNTSLSSMESLELLRDGTPPVLTTIVTAAPTTTAQTTTATTTTIPQAIPIVIEATPAASAMPSVPRNTPTTSNIIPGILRHSPARQIRPDPAEKSPTVLHTPLPQPQQGAADATSASPASDRPATSPGGCSSSSTQSSPSDQQTPSTADQSQMPRPERRVRKTSWINPIIGGKTSTSPTPPPTTTTTSAGSTTIATSVGYAATVDKLLSLFHHPGHFFTRQSPANVVEESTTPQATTTTTTTAPSAPTVHSTTPVRKLSISPAPPAPSTSSTGTSASTAPRKDMNISHLFGWTSAMVVRKDPSESSDSTATASVSSPTSSASTGGESMQSSSSLLSSPSASASSPPPLMLQQPTTSTGAKSPLQPNSSPPANQTATTTTTTSSVQTTIGTSGTVIEIQSMVHPPPQLHGDMKENISPEHTLTASSAADSAATADHKSTGKTPSPEPAPMPLPADVEKVRFALGGDDDDDDDDDDHEEEEDLSVNADLDISAVRIHLNEDDSDDDESGCDDDDERIRRRCATVRQNLAAATQQATGSSSSSQAPTSAASSHTISSCLSSSSTLQETTGAIGQPGLGQITRDSLSILHGSMSSAAILSLDSVRSLEALDESDAADNSPAR